MTIQSLVPWILKGNSRRCKGEIGIMANVNRMVEYCVPYSVRKQLDRKTIVYVICITIVSVVLSVMLTSFIYSASDWYDMMYGYDNSVYRSVDIERKYHALQGDGRNVGIDYYSRIPRR